MITRHVQRWRTRRGTCRPAGEPIDTRRYEVAPIADDRTARAFVESHHYSGSYPAARRRFGLYHGEDLVGVAVFSVPCNPRSLAVLPGDPAESVELGRFVLLDEVPSNGETWFLGRCFEHLRREGFTGVLSFSDPVARHLVDGSVVFAGHVGTIYQAHNGIFLGRSTPRTLRLLPDGTTLSDRAISKIRRRERGCRYATALLERHGAAPLGSHEDPAAYLAEWLPRLTRPLRHPGNFRYVWALRRGDRRHLPPQAAPYPKFSFGGGF